MNAATVASRTLDDWLAWQSSLHGQTMDLGLERVRAVFQRLPSSRPAPLVITVGGTNGKGSAVAMLEAILLAGGYRVGAFTSPYLHRFTEQIRLNGHEVDEIALCQAYQRVEAVRGTVALTAFEFTTLAAVALFAQQALDVAILEVGLGGRDDAVNVVDGDGALITTVDLDHQDWLGADRERIGWHKAGIFRADRLAVCADPDPPRSLVDHALGIGARLLRRDEDFEFSRLDRHQWVWSSAHQRLVLPRPGLPGEHQFDNAAGVLALLHGLRDSLPLDARAMAAGLKAASLPGRLQSHSGRIQWILDVAHNRQAVEALARALTDNPGRGQTRAVVGMLGDKDASVIGYLAPLVAHWYPASLEGPRGRDARTLADIIATWDGVARPPVFPSVAAACRAAENDAEEHDRILVFGSFVTVAAALEANPMRQWNHG